MKIGDLVESKNDYEFCCTIIEINGRNITLEYIDMYPERVVVDKKHLHETDNEIWMDKWTARFKQI